MKKVVIVVIVCILIVLLGVGIYFGVGYFTSENEENQTLENGGLGSIEKETVSDLIAKFNTEIMDSGMEYPASEEYLTIDNDQYWYGMYDDIYCVITPEEFTGDQTVDTVSMMIIYIPNDSANGEMALQYVESLIKANNSEITDEEVTNLMEEAETQKANGLASNNGKGISVGIFEGEEHTEYQVIRAYAD